VLIQFIPEDSHDEDDAKNDTDLEDKVIKGKLKDDPKLCHPKVIARQGTTPKHLWSDMVSHASLTLTATSLLTVLSACK